MLTSGLMSMAMTVALGVGPYGPVDYGYAGGFAGGYAGGGYGTTTLGYGGVYDQLYPFDSQDQWRHGYFQEIPAYGGFHAFRPYNYHHVFSQAQTAGGWGMSPSAPYAQQFWHRYQDYATMKRHMPIPSLRQQHPGMMQAPRQ